MQFLGAKLQVVVEVEFNVTNNVAPPNVDLIGMPTASWSLTKNDSMTFS